MAGLIFDTILLTDPRFMGGTSSAVIADVKAFSNAGLRVGLTLIRSSGFFRVSDEENPEIRALADLPGVTLLEPNPSRPVSCDVAFFHHPSVFERPVEASFRISANLSVVVTHQPLFLGDGALAFDPFRVQRNIRSQFGSDVWWAPVSGICREHFRAFAPFLKMTNLNWPNSFEVDTWFPHRQKLQSNNLVIGRHGRPHHDKWPETGTEINQSLPSDHRTKVRVMGADRAFLEEKGVMTSGWDILEFNQEPVIGFLDSLDVFSYHHSPFWVEAFGRTIAESMLMGVRCILSPELRPTFGTNALYGRPEEVASILDHIRNNLEDESQAALAARKYCIQSYSTAAILPRFENLKLDTGTTDRKPTQPVHPLKAAKKLFGFRRRRWLDNRKAG